MQTITINNSRLMGEINAISSKSYVHRLLICAFLSGEELSLDGIDLSKDITATFNALKTIRDCKTILDAGESGSTLRFLIPLVSTLGKDFQIKMHGKLKDRPNDELYTTLKTGGVNAYTLGDIVYVSGKLKAGEYFIKADKSSQYLSGLLMALSSLKEQSKIILTSPVASKAYVDITVEVLKSYGYKVSSDGKTYIVGGKRNKNSKPITSEGDWSNSAFFLVGGASCGDVTIKNLNLNSVQADKEIFNILRLAGANVIAENNSVRVKKSNLKGFTYSIDNCPDLAPICAVLGAYASGETILTDVGRLKIKESDRVLSTISMLNSCGVIAKEQDNKIIIKGGNVTGGTIDGFNDHRIVMSGAIMALASNGSITINGASAVQKSYPQFFNDLEKLGGIISAKI